jgi:AcrR family transcriptional regulator
MSTQPAKPAKPPTPPSTASTTPSYRRLKRADRRHMLLKAAATLLVRGGAGAVTMEAVATEAGVSKPVVYDHFANATDLLTAMTADSFHLLDQEVFRALDKAESFEQLIEALSRPYFDALAEPGTVFRELFLHRSRNEALNAWHDQRRAGALTFMSGIVSRRFGLDGATAMATVTGLVGAFDAIAIHWCMTEALSRQAAERIFTQLALGALEQIGSAGSGT